MNPPPSHLRTPKLLIAAWLLIVGVGSLAMVGYANRPGNDADAPSRWPADSALELDRQHPTLLMFAHPKCPCTVASVGELARIMAAAHGRLHAVVVFVQPAGADERWARARLWEKTGEIAGVQRVLDARGREARLFQASTAGRTLLYSTAGRRLFEGGITVARGHAGDNAGEDAILAALGGATPSIQSTAAFGCPLFDPPKPTCP